MTIRNVKHNIEKRRGKNRYHSTTSNHAAIQRRGCIDDNSRGYFTTKVVELEKLTSPDYFPEWTESIFDGPEELEEAHWPKTRGFGVFLS